MSEDKRRSWAEGTEESREGLRAELEAAGITPEGKTIDLDDVFQLLQERTAAAQQAQAAPSADDVMMQTFAAAGLDPSVLNHWRAVAAEQSIPFTTFVMGHLMNAQMAGGLNAPAQDQGWAVDASGSGNTMSQYLEYTCQNPRCGKQEKGRLGQLYCSNICAATHKRLQKQAAHQAQVQSRAQTLRRKLRNLFAGDTIDENELHDLETMFGGAPPSTGIDEVDTVLNNEREELGADGVAVGPSVQAMLRGGREVVRAAGA